MLKTLIKFFYNYHTNHRERNFRQLNMSYFKFMFGFNFRIVQCAHVEYSTCITENFCQDLISHVITDNIYYTAYAIPVIQKKKQATRLWNK